MKLVITTVGTKYKDIIPLYTGYISTNFNIYAYDYKMVPMNHDTS